MKTLKTLENKLNFLSISKERKGRIPNLPRKARSQLFALEYINYKNINSLPIEFSDYETLFNNYEWIIMTYSEAQKSLKKDDPLNIKKKKALARTLHIREDNVFLTVYIENQKFPRQNYYTIAHELGHIVLGHFFEYDSTSLSRGGLTKGQYSVLEREAEIFAAELIMPMPVLKSIKIKSYTDIIDICKVTKNSSQIRIKEMSNFIITTYIYNLYEKTKSTFYNFIYTKQCLKCGHSFVSENAKYCPICGHKNLLWGDGKMIYDDGFELDENSKALICPRCENEQMAIVGDHCKICGTYLINKCTNESGYSIGNNDWVEPCGSIADGNARYCEYCGSQTTFYNQGLLKDWQKAKVEIEEELFRQEAASTREFEDGDIPF